MVVVIVVPIMVAMVIIVAITEAVVIIVITIDPPIMVHVATNNAGEIDGIVYDATHVAIINKKSFIAREKY